MDDLGHQFIRFIFISLFFWQVILGVYIILVWAKRNIKSKGFDYPIEVLKDRLEGKKLGPTGPVEVNIKKNLIVDTKSDEASVKLDEKIKGKVKTQKNKLRSLRK